MGRPKGPTYKKAIALRLEDDLWGIIENLARGEDRPLGSMARVLLREAIVARGKKSKATSAGRKRNRKEGGG